MREQDLRRQIAEIGRRLWLRGYVAANDGNLSARLDSGDVLVTPAAVSKGFLDPALLVVVSTDGSVAGTGRPTSELGMHLAIYGIRPDVRAVVHAHPPAATAFAVSGEAFDGRFLPEVVVSVGDVPTAPYALPSTPEVARSIEPLIRTSNALLLENHGVVTVGRDLDEAYFRMETVEHAASIAIRARSLGGPRMLSDEEIARLGALAADPGKETG